MPESSDRIGPRPSGPSTALRAFAEGWRRTARAPWLVVSIWVVTFVAGLLLAGTFGAPADGPVLATLYGPPGIGGAASVVASRLSNIAWVSRDGAGLLLYTILSLVVVGGLFDRLARARPVRPRAFVEAGRYFFFRCLRLTVLALPAYALTTRWEPLADSGALTAAIVLLLDLLVDFAFVRIVVEDRRSALAALGAGGRFVRRRLLPSAFLYGLHVATGTGLLWVSNVVVIWTTRPSDEYWPLGLALWLLLVSLIIVIARVARTGSAVAYFQAELAHVAEPAAGEPVWPDAPAAG